MLANNEKNSSTKRKIIIKRCFHRKKRVDAEVKRLEVTQAIEMEIYVVNHDKNKHFHYHFGLLLL